MPYGGEESEEQTKKIESCVSQVMAKGKDKATAIAICKTAILGNATLALTAATEQDILTLQADLADNPNLFSAREEMPTNAILKFEGACLARAEVNLNRDGINTEGIKQLADTIRLMPLTLEHEKEPRGVFTRGYTNEDSTECLVDGFLWAGHWPEFAEEVRNGIRKLSIDAEADLAVCSICGQAFQSTVEYCEHMRKRNSYDAVRWLFDLRAVAGGAVLNPAGTNTVFPGKDGITIISHKKPAQFEIPEREKEILDLAANVQETSGGNSMKVKCTQCGAELDVAHEADALQAELQAKLQELENAKKEIATVQAALVDAQSKLEAETKTTERFVEMVQAAGIEVAQEALPSIRKVDDETFGIMKSLASKIQAGENRPEKEKEPEEENPPMPQNLVASHEEPVQAAGDDIWNLEF